MKQSLRKFDTQLAVWRGELDQEWASANDKAECIENLIQNFERVIEHKANDKDYAAILHCLCLVFLQNSLNQAELYRNEPRSKHENH